jgi:hypothetical protein
MRGALLCKLRQLLLDPVSICRAMQVPATLQTLSEVMNAYESSLHSEASGAAAGGEGGAGTQGFAPVLDAILDPLLEMCRR